MRPPTVQSTGKPKKYRCNNIKSSPDKRFGAKIIQNLRFGQQRQQLKSRRWASL